MIDYLRTLFLRDFWLKLFSLALAVLIWLTITFTKEGSPLQHLGATGSERTYFNIPVNVMLSASDVAERQGVTLSPREVEVKVRADAKRIDELQPRDIRALVDLRGIESGGLRKRIDVTTPAGVTLIEVVPDEAEVIVPPKH
jgi:YbbR domain-containing protein